jgi:hypothetical protein
MAGNYLVNKTSLYMPQPKDTKSYVDSMRKPFTIDPKTLPSINDKLPNSISDSPAYFPGYVLFGYADEGYVDGD